MKRFVLPVAAVVCRNDDVFFVRKRSYEESDIVQTPDIKPDEELLPSAVRFHGENEIDLQSRHVRK